MEKIRVRVNDPASTVTAMISICSARPNEKRLEGNKGRSPLSSALKRLFVCSWALLC